MLRWIFIAFPRRTALPFDHFVIIELNPAYFSVVD
jgi:hypothetical protein